MNRSAHDQVIRHQTAGMLYSQNVGFQNFLGNAATVTHLRESVRAGRFPHSLILAGPRGSGKYTLALMLAQAVNCLNHVGE